MTFDEWWKSDDCIRTVWQIENVARKAWETALKANKEPGAEVPCSDGLDPSFPTRQDIEAMAKNNPVLYRAIKTAEMLKVQTWAEVLQLAVKCLVEYSDAQNERMIKIVELSGKPFVIE